MNSEEPQISDMQVGKFSDLWQKYRDFLGGSISTLQHDTSSIS